ncbi:MAG: hypothetical protein WAW03_11925 [Anaerolineae bacterium]
MIRDTELQELVEMMGKKGPVLSLYLNVDPHRRTVEKYKLALRRLLASVDDQASSADLQRVLRYFDFEYNWHGRGVACFSCQADGFWRAYPLFVPIEDSVFVNPRPYIKPLSNLVDNYARHGVAVVDHEGVRLFLFYMGTLEDVSGMLGEDVKHHRAGGRSAARFQRAAEETVERNVKDAVEEAIHFFESSCKRIMVAGTDDNVSLFRSQLPRAWQERVVGTFNVDANASAAEIGELALNVARQVAVARERALVEQVVTTASKGGPAVMGLADTVTALQDGRVMQLVMTEGYEAPAYRCQNCSYISIVTAATCDFCGGPMLPVPDVINTLVRRTLEAGNSVVVVSGDDSPNLSLLGNIGALLRY